MIDKEKKMFHVKASRVRIPLPSPSSYEQKLKKETAEVIQFLNRLKNKRFWI